MTSTEANGQTATVKIEPTYITIRVPVIRFLGPTGADAMVGMPLHMALKTHHRIAVHALIEGLKAVNGFPHLRKHDVIGFVLDEICKAMQVNAPVENTKHPCPTCDAMSYVRATTGDVVYMLCSECGHKWATTRETTEAKPKPKAKDHGRNCP